MKTIIFPILDFIFFVVIKLDFWRKYFVHLFSINSYKSWLLFSILEKKKIFSIQLNDDLMSHITICIYQAVYLGRLFEMKRNMRTMCSVTLINRWTMDHDIIAHLLRSVPGITHFYLALGSFRSVIWYKQFPQLRKNHLPTIITLHKACKAIHT